MELKKPQPCPVKWEETEERPGGRHCLQCDKFLRDFRKETWAEIQQVQQGEAGPYCGVFTPKQIQYWGQEVPKPQLGNPKLLKALAMFSSLFLLAPQTKGQSPKSYRQVHLERFSPDSVAPTKKELLGHAPPKVVLTGTVRQAENSLPILGATVYIAELGIGGYTDEFGRFSIPLPEAHYDDSLVLSVQYFGNIPLKQQLIPPFDKPLSVMMEDAGPELIAFYISEPAPLHIRIWGRIKGVFRRLFP